MYPVPSSGCGCLCELWLSLPCEPAPQMQLRVQHLQLPGGPFVSNASLHRCLRYRFCARCLSSYSSSVYPRTCPGCSCLTMRPLGAQTRRPRLSRILCCRRSERPASNEPAISSSDHKSVIRLLADIVQHGLFAT